MGGLVMVMLVALTLTACFVGAAIWWTTRTLRRLRRFTGRLVDRGTLAARAHLVGGAPGQAAGAQLRLRSGLDQTRRVLDDAQHRNCPLGDLPGLFRRVEHLAASVDAELRMLGRDTDPGQQARLVAVLRRSDELTSMAAAIRRTVSSVHADMQLDPFTTLQRDLDVELSALRGGAATIRHAATLTRP
jgi:hypothetical protein